MEYSGSIRAGTSFFNVHIDNPNMSSDFLD